MSPNHTLDVPQTTLIFTSSGGRFANQLLNFAHLIALAAEHPWIRVVDMDFWRFADLLESTQANPICSYPARSNPGSPGNLLFSCYQSSRRFMPDQINRILRSVVPPLMHRSRPWASILYRDADYPGPLGGPRFLNLVRGRRTVLLGGWMRDWDLLSKHRNTVRGFLAPAARFQNVAQSFIADLRRRHYPLIGLMLRQSDYRLFEQGKFFFTTAQYRGFMEQLQQRFGPNCAIVIAADEDQPPDALEGLRAYWCTGAKPTGGHYVESFAELSMCDCVASVPSSFAYWAAFMGKKPALPILRADNDLTRTPLLDDPLLQLLAQPIDNLKISEI